MMPPMRRRFPVLTNLLLLLLFSGTIILLPGCYVLKQGMFLAHYQSHAEDIGTILQRDDIDSKTRAFLEEVLSIKRFAREHLGLEDNKNYSRYVYTERNYLVDVVTACAADSFTPYTWKFPIVGEVPYKGFYQKKDAERLAKRLRKEGYDVWVRQVDAFSTLGYFTDPIYSFMEEYPTYYLADLIIHEQTHATIYIKDQTQFNEELATFIGGKGALAYIEYSKGTANQTETDIFRIEKDREQFLSMIRDLYTRLNIIYTSSLEKTKKLQEKNHIISSFQDNLQKNYKSYFSTDTYRYIADMKLNNAHIISWNIYVRDLSLYDTVYEALDGNLLRFVETISKVKDYSGDPKEYLQSLIP